MKYGQNKWSIQAVSQESCVYFKEWMKQIAKNLSKR